MDDVFERGLLSFASQAWWIQFIEAVQENHNEVSYLPDQISPAGPNKTLFWALNTATDLVDASEIKKKEKILSYVTENDMGMLKFLELFAHLGTSLPIGLKVSALIREFVNPRNGQYRSLAVKQLIGLEPTQVVLDLLEEIGKQKARTLDKDAIAAYHIITVNAIWITSVIAKKDPKFVTQVLEFNKLKFVHELVKKNFFHPKNEVHYPCLKILRVLVKVSKVGHLLAKDKFFQTLRKILELYLGTPSTKFQMVLEILVILTRTSKAQCKRFLKAGCLITLMRVFSFWPVWKGRGLPKMSKCVLNIYLQLATTYAGRKALIRTDALHNIRHFCENCPNDKQFDEIIMRAFAVNSLTYGKHKLPFKDISSPAKFEIVGGNGKKTRDSGTSSDEDDPDDLEEVLPKTKRTRVYGDEDDDDDDNVDSEFMISDIELDDGNNDNETDDDDVTLTESRPVSAVSVRKRESQGRLGRPVTPYPRPKSSKPKMEGSPDYCYLLAYAQFFQEFDHMVNVPILHYNDKTYESIVGGLLRRFISAETHDANIPKSELKPDTFGGKSYYFEGSIPAQELRKTYLVVSNQVRSVIPFVKVAYPEITFAYGGRKIELTTSTTDRFILREKMTTLMQRNAGVGAIFKPLVVYDLDALLHKYKSPVATKSKSKLKAGLSTYDIHASAAQNLPTLGNDDELKVGQFEKKKNHSLKFESRFEGGNLRKAIQVGEREYDLYMMSDVNSTRHNQWFYFQVSNTPEDSPVTFNIVNCIKTSSQFNYGMQPVVFSVMEAMQAKPGWVRAGTNVMYYRNGFRNPAGKKRKYYYSATFTLTFAKRGDIVYIAYHYPYSYSRLLTELWRMTRMASETKRIFVRYDMLCHSENENEVPLMTVTAPNHPRHPIELREVIFLSSRVHPGEPNSSWVMHGVLHQLLFGSNMEEILQRYVFKILPMLNVEGVINGCGRCGLTDEDLNRRWKDPDPKLHPSIYHSKALIEYCCKMRAKIPALYCDLHGHSRRKNVFFYGCSLAKSWSPEDRNKDEEPNSIQALPEAMARRVPTFQISYCKFDVRKERETTARVALWREFGIRRSYTLESTYCGCDRGPYKGVSIGISQLIEVGEALIESCAELNNPPPSSVSMFDIPSEWSSHLLTNDSSKINLISFPAEPRYKKKASERGEPTSTRTKTKKKLTRRARDGKKQNKSSKKH